MNSAFLNKIGLGNVDIGHLFLILFILLIILIIGVGYIIYENIKFRIAYKKFMKGSTADSLEEKIFQMCEEQDSLRKLGIKHSREIKELYAKHQSAFQKVGLVKYDAFKEMGGKLSFAIALLNKENTGFVLNAMHSREGCYMYIKEIIGGKSAIILGDEEKEALDKAINSDNYME